MDGATTVILISVAMFIGCFLLGLIPLLINFSQEKLQFVAVLGAGLLCGTALAIIIPEGVELLQDSPREAVKPPLLGSNLTVEPFTEKGCRNNVFIGASLVLGFTLMFVVDQIAEYCSSNVSRATLYTGSSTTATLGLLIHAAADGMALGAAVASSRVTVEVIVFFAVILHKAPAAFGLVTFLMHAGLEKSTIQKHLLAFSAAAPLMAISSYFILSLTGGSSQYRLNATGIGMLVSAGTFLYVATVHVLPDITNRGQQRSTHNHSYSTTGPYQHSGMGLMDSLALIAGAGFPVLLALGLPDD